MAQLRRWAGEHMSSQLLTAKRAGSRERTSKQAPLLVEIALLGFRLPMGAMG